MSKKHQNNDFTNFTLFCGYVESQSLASIVLGHETGFDDVMTAMEDIRSVCLSIVLSRVKSCCSKSKTNYCPTCGKQRSALYSKSNSNYHAAELFRSLWQSNIDSASDEGIWEAFEEKGWDLCGNGAEGKSATVVNVDRWIEEDGGTSVHMQWTSEDGEGSNSPWRE